MTLKTSDLPTTTTKHALRRMTPKPMRTYSVAEWLAMPDERPYTELVDGVLHKMTAGTPNHGRIIARIRAALEDFVYKSALGQVDGEMNVIVDGITGRNGWIPDLAFASNNSGVKIKSEWTGCPDWVLEVWAGNEKRPQRIVEKRNRWQRAGVPEIWEVISRPGQQSVNVYRRNKQGIYQPVPVENDVVCSEVIAGFCMERAAVFANLVEE